MIHLSVMRASQAGVLGHIETRIASRRARTTPDRIMIHLSVVRAWIGRATLYDRLKWRHDMENHALAALKLEGWRAAKDKARFLPEEISQRAVSLAKSVGVTKVRA